MSLDIKSLLMGMAVSGGGGGGGGGSVLCSWDFTKGATPLVDTILGITLTSSNVTFDGDGAHFGSDAKGVISGIPYGASAVAVEIDVGAMSLTADANRRLLVSMDATGNGLIYRNTGAWGVYVSSWDDTEYTSGSEFANSTIKVAQAVDGVLHIYKNGAEWFTSTKKLKAIGLQIGSTSSIINTVIKAVRLVKI